MAKFVEVGSNVVNVDHIVRTYEQRAYDSYHMNKYIVTTDGTSMLVQDEKFDEIKDILLEKKND
jgi:hypothetical protein